LHPRHLPSFPTRRSSDLVVFVTQPPIVRELNGAVSNTFLSVVTIFGNHLADTAHAGRGGDLWLMLPNQGLVNLTKSANLGAAGRSEEHTSELQVTWPSRM